MSTTEYLPDIIGSNTRQPTIEECAHVGRDLDYADPLEGSRIGDWGD